MLRRSSPRTPSIVIAPFVTAAKPDERADFDVVRPTVPAAAASGNPPDRERVGADALDARAQVDRKRARSGRAARRRRSAAWSCRGRKNAAIKAFSWP